MAVIISEASKESFTEYILTNPDLVKNKLVRFISDLFDYHNEIERPFVSIDFAKEKGYSNATVSRHLATLVKNDVVTRTGSGSSIDFDFSRDNAPNYKLLKNFLIGKNKAKKIVQSKSRTSESSIKQQLAIFEQEGYMTLDPDTQVALVSDRLFNGILDTALAENPKDSRRVIETNLAMGSETLKVKSVCTSDQDSKLMCVPDLRLVRILDSYITSEIKRIHGNSIKNGTFRFSDVRNSFVLDVKSLCIEMKIAPSGDNPRRVAEALNRMEETKFEMDTSSSDNFTSLLAIVREFIGQQHSGIDLEKLHHPKLSYFNSVEPERKHQIHNEQGEIVDEVSRLYIAEINTLYLGFLCIGVMKRTVQESILHVTHEELKVDRTIWQRVYNWSRSNIGSNPSKLITYEWKSFVSKVLPNLQSNNNTYRNFKNQFVKHYEDCYGTGSFNEHGENEEVSIYGYIYKWEGRNENILSYCRRLGRAASKNHNPKGTFKPLISIRLDHNDSLIGRSGIHNSIVDKTVQEELPDLAVYED